MYKFKEVIKHHLSCRQDYSGEYETSCKIDFMLAEPKSFEIMGTTYTIDRVRLRDVVFSCDEMEVVFANAETVYEGIKIPRWLFKALYCRVLKEQKTGCMKGYCFEDTLKDMYEDMYQKKK